MRLIDADGLKQDVDWMIPSPENIFRLIDRMPTIDAQSALPPNDPLTLAELREMDGEPVWCTNDCGEGYWMIAHVYGDMLEQIECVHRASIAWDGHRYVMRGGFGWRAYRRKPEGRQNYES